MRATISVILEDEKGDNYQFHIANLNQNPAQKVVILNNGLLEKWPFRYIANIQGESIEFKTLRGVYIQEISITEYFISTEQLNSFIVFKNNLLQNWIYSDEIGS